MTTSAWGKTHKTQSADPCKTSVIEVNNIYVSLYPTFTQLH